MRAKRPPTGFGSTSDRCAECAWALTELWIPQHVSAQCLVWRENDTSAPWETSQPLSSGHLGPHILDTVHWRPPLDMWPSRPPPLLSLAPHRPSLTPPRSTPMRKGERPWRATHPSLPPPPGGRGVSAEGRTANATPLSTPFFREERERGLLPPAWSQNACEPRDPTPLKSKRLPMSAEATKYSLHYTCGPKPNLSDNLAEPGPSST